MRFINDDLPQCRQRGKNCGTGADHAGHAALGDLLPDMPPLSWLQPAVQNSHRQIKPPHQHIDHLGGKRNLWHQHNTLPPFLRCMRDQPQIKLGLATAGYAMQQKRPIPACLLAKDGIEHRLLFRAERGRLGRRLLCALQHALPFHSQQSSLRRRAQEGA